MKLTRQTTGSLKQIDSALVLALKTDLKLYKTFDNKFYDAHLQPVSDIVYMLRGLWFSIFSNGLSWDAFYESFDSPGLPRGKPVAWIEKEGFIPDRVTDAILNVDLSFNDKIKAVGKMYDQCLKIQRKFNRVNKK